jgi:uncharacterized membrane protein YgcG
MKKIIIVLTVFAILSVLVACSQRSPSTGTTGNSASLSTEAQLLVGTFKLEDSDLAVTSEQAKQLLPLWQTLQSLSSSSTAATEEISAVVDQVKGTMTTSQMAKITAMKLIQTDIMSIMNQAGVSPNGTSSTTTPMPRGGGFPTGGGTQGGGGAPGGGAPGGAGGPPSGGFPGGGDPGIDVAPGGASATPQANRPAGMGNQVPPPLLNALIQLLQKKIK